MPGSEVVIAVGTVAGAAGALVGLSLAGRSRRLSPPRPRAAALPGTPGAQAVLEALPVAVLVVDVAQEVLLANRAAHELGLVANGVVAELPQLRALVDEARVRRRPQEAVLESRFPRPGRAPAAYRARLAPVGDGTVAVLLEDVTEARRLEDVRRDFVANVSHELKTPVGALGLLADAISDPGADVATVRRFAARVQVEAERLGRLVQELVDLSRLQGAEPLAEAEPVPVDDVVAEAVDRTRTAAQARGIALVRSGQRGLQVLGSEPQLVTALCNLLSNAVAYSGDGTRVAVSARRTDDGGVELEVADQGIGIDEADQERIFERFYRADPARSRATGGTGLGLAIVKHVATNHGGTVSVRSRLGEGSTFVLRLPAA